MSNINDLINAMKKAYESGYKYFGIRTIEDGLPLLSVGDSVPDSYDWDLEEDCSTRETTGETLNGACAVGINSFVWEDEDDEIAEAISKAIEMSMDYPDGQKLLIGSKYGYEYGNDPDEMILESADVIAII